MQMEKSTPRVGLENGVGLPQGAHPRCARLTPEDFPFAPTRFVSSPDPRRVFLCPATLAVPRSQGTILRNDVSGSIMVKCYLSGTPECKFGLNDKLLLDNEAKAKKVCAA